MKNSSQDEATYSKKWVIEAITEMGRKLDQQWKKGKVNDDYLKKFAADNNFWYLATISAITVVTVCPICGTSLT